jgi:hypothetical protein
VLQVSDLHFCAVTLCSKIGDCTLEVSGGGLRGSDRFGRQGQTRCLNRTAGLVELGACGTEYRPRFLESGVGLLASVGQLDMAGAHGQGLSFQLVDLIAQRCDGRVGIRQALCQGLLFSFGTFSFGKQLAPAR